MIEAVTFDFWDCIVADDSDEPRRAARGLAPKPRAREDAFVAEVLAHHPELPRARVAAALERANATFRHQWKVEHRTPPVADRLDDAFRDLGLDRTPGFDALVAAFETMEVDVPPDLAPGIAEALDGLSDRYRIGIVSDAIVTPGTGLREILRRYELLHHFAHCVFSDEAGASKPSPLVFQRAADGLGVPVEAIVHVGDREANDVAGPLGVGAKAVLYTGVVDRGSADTRAHAVCADHRELPAIVEAL